MAKKIFVGEMLLKAGLITEAQLRDALEVQATTGKRVGDIFVAKGILSNNDLMRILENQFNVPYVDLDKVTLNYDLTRLVPIALARRNNLVPVRIENSVLYVAIEDPKNFPALDDVRTTSRMEVQPLLAKEQSIRDTIEKLYSSQVAERALEDVRKEINLDEMVQHIDNDMSDEVVNAPVVRLVNAIMEQAVNLGASDIHIEQMPAEVRVRMRVDGVLSTALKAPKSVAAAMMTRLKILSNLNIAEKRLPQDGRFELNVLGHSIDIRLSTLPTVFGEKAVMRLLDRSTFLKPKASLGFTEVNLKKFDELLHTPHGIILVSGPTGSGKSTTLYTMLDEMNNVSDNIVTVEDPVEYMIAGLNQVHVNPKAGLDFASGLRSILRQDPDIIMIGEIRDAETVDIAIRAAITGHLVLSTIHTNDSVSTIFRLADMGVPYYMIAASLVGVISQRLVRTICPACKQEYTPTQNELDLAGMTGNATFYKGLGCANCAGTGYKGRIAVHEILEVDSAMRDYIHREEPMGKMREHCVTHGMVPIKDSAIALLRRGVTTIEQVIDISHGT
ncbi:hypothetical protein FACS1894217_03020 [Clostridia bacterium]|nr:hypothetical protein FACS1894217_03020 [Clostridia bacterium]